MSATAAKKSTPASKTGRPTDYTEELSDQICSLIAEGRSMRSITRDEAFPAMTTLFRWLREKPEFRQQYAIAREQQAETFADEIQDIADDGANDFMTVTKGDKEYNVVNHENIQRSRLRVDTRKWIASKLKPKKYGDRTEVDFNPINPVTFISEVPAPKSNQEDPLPNETDSTDPPDATN